MRNGDTSAQFAEFRACSRSQSEYFDGLQPEVTELAFVEGAASAPGPEPSCVEGAARYCEEGACADRV